MGKLRAFCSVRVDESVKDLITAQNTSYEAITPLELPRGIALCSSNGSSNRRTLAHRQQDRETQSHHLILFLMRSKMSTRPQTDRLNRVVRVCDFEQRLGCCALRFTMVGKISRGVGAD